MPKRTVMRGAATFRVGGRTDRYLVRGQRPICCAPSRHRTRPIFPLVRRGAARSAEARRMDESHSLGSVDGGASRPFGKRSGTSGASITVNGTGFSTMASQNTVQFNGTAAAVVSATVNVICELSRKNPKNYLPLAPQLFNLLTTSNNNWMVIKVIKLVCRPTIFFINSSLHH